MSVIQIRNLQLQNLFRKQSPDHRSRLGMQPLLIGSHKSGLWHHEQVQLYKLQIYLATSKWLFSNCTALRVHHVLSCWLKYQRDTNGYKQQQKSNRNPTPPFHLLRGSWSAQPAWLSSNKTSPFVAEERLWQTLILWYDRHLTKIRPNQATALKKMLIKNLKLLSALGLSV